MLGFLGKRFLMIKSTKSLNLPETIKSGKRAEKTQPAMTGLSGMLVITARGSPNPRK